MALPHSFLVSASIIMAIAGLLLWIWHHTYYKISDTQIKYYSGPFSGKIEIIKIKTITINTTSFVGLKFGLARNGLIIELESHTDLYISPTKPQDFVKELMAHNASIKLKA